MSNFITLHMIETSDETKPIVFHRDHVVSVEPFAGVAHLDGHWRSGWTSIRLTNGPAFAVVEPFERVVSMLSDPV